MKEFYDSIFKEYDRLEQIRELSKKLDALNTEKMRLNQLSAINKTLDLNAAASMFGQSSVNKILNVTGGAVGHLNQFNEIGKTLESVGRISPSLNQFNEIGKTLESVGRISPSLSQFRETGKTLELVGRITPSLSQFSEIGKTFRATSGLAPSLSQFSEMYQNLNTLENIFGFKIAGILDISNQFNTINSQYLNQPCKVYKTPNIIDQSIETPILKILESSDPVVDIEEFASKIDKPKVINRIKEKIEKRIHISKSSFGNFTNLSFLLNEDFQVFLIDSQDTWYKGKPRNWKTHLLVQWKSFWFVVKVAGCDRLIQSIKNKFNPLEKPRL